MTKITTLLIFTVCFLLFRSDVYADWKVDYLGRLVYVSPQNVLGVSDEKEKDKKDKEDKKDHEVAPTATPAPEVTVADAAVAATDIPTVAPTIVETVTPTPIPPTATLFPSPTATDTPIPTAISDAPTNTPTPSVASTVILSVTNTPIPSSPTSPPPTSTIQPTFTPTPSLSSPVNHPTATPGPQPTQTPTPSPTSIPLPAPTIVAVNNKQSEPAIASVYTNMARALLEKRNGKLVIKAQDSQGHVFELGEQNSFVVEDRTTKAPITILMEKNDQVIIAKGQFGARTNFPLSVDLSKNAILVTTFAGDKEIIFNPESIVDSLLFMNVIDHLYPAEPHSTSSYRENLGIRNVVSLEEFRGIPTYLIEGVRRKMLLGFQPIAIPTIITASAWTGEVVREQKTLAGQILEAFSL
ncbi:hypothetical protein HY358_01525 [Candidatus Roizmanbacteria bacterium]|nr:hypothetical protein [Candidatus Roizmanbacteria bacterium]